MDFLQTLLLDECVSLIRAIKYLSRKKSIAWLHRLTQDTLGDPTSILERSRVYKKLLVQTFDYLLFFTTKILLQLKMLFKYKCCILLLLHV